MTSKRATLGVRHRNAALESGDTSPQSKWRPYPKYKDSGVEWLGEIPAHWEVRSLKRVFSVFNGSTPQSRIPEFWEGKIAWVTPEDLGKLEGAEIFDTQRYITEQGYRSCGTSLVPAGSLVLSTRAPIGYLGIAGIELCTNQGCRSLVFRRQSERKYFYYELFSAKAELASLGQGSTFNELSRDTLEQVVIAEPPRDEQASIATFLDRETAKIDALIEKKERLIGLLQEKRTALITQAVTKGLDPTVPMKDSDVERLGRIPVTWQVSKFWQFVTKGDEFASGPFGSNIGSSFYQDGGVPIIRGNNLSINGEKPKYNNNGYAFISELKAYELSHSNAIAGDLVFTARGTTGQVGLIPSNSGFRRFILSANQLRFRPDPAVWRGDFLWYLFSSTFMRSQVLLESESVAQPNLNLGSLKGLRD